MFDDLGVHPVPDRGDGGTTYAVIDMRGEHDTSELVIKAVHSLIVERDFEADGDECGTKLLGEEARGLDGPIDLLVELHAHFFAVRPDDGVEASRLIVDVGVDVEVEVGAVEVEVEVDPAFDDRDDDDRFDAGAARA